MYSAAAHRWVPMSAQGQRMAARLQVSVHGGEPMVLIRGLAYASLVLFVSTCCGPPRRSHGIQRIRAATPQGPATGELWVFGDSHIHNAPGAATRAKSAFGDSLSPVAIRPPSLDLWAEVVLSSVVARMHEEAPGTPAFFLGDAADVSCIDEYDRFLTATGPPPPPRTSATSASTSARSDLQWFGVMGNHDGYFMGNSTFEPRGASGQNTWQGACAIDGERGHRRWAVRDRLDRLERDLWKVAATEETHVDQGVLTKAHAIWMYLDHLWKRGVITADPLECNNWIPIDWKPSAHQTSFTCSTWTPKTGSHRVFRAAGTYLGTEERSISLVASIDSATVHSRHRTQPWHSYLVQDVELPDRNHAILVDTSDYLNSPPSFDTTAALTWLKNRGSVDCWKQRRDYSLPGRCGEVGSAQIAEIEKFLLASRRAQPNLRYFLLGHHPWKALRQDSVNRLTERLTEHPGLITYLSAHFHAAASTLGTDADYHWEINIGSTTDWPMEYAKLSYWLSETNPRSSLLQVVRKAAIPDDNTCPYGGPADPGARGHDRREINYGAPDAYITRALEVYHYILRAAISSSPTAEGMQTCSIDGVQTDLSGVLHLVDKTSTAPATELQRKRWLLDQVSQCDRTVLRELTGVREIEINCAAWASKLEFDTNAGAERIRFSDRDPETFQIISAPSASPRR
jgi:hypothetical protein